MMHSCLCFRCEHLGHLGPIDCTDSICHEFLCINFACYPRYSVDIPARRSKDISKLVGSPLGFKVALSSNI